MVKVGIGSEAGTAAGGPKRFNSPPPSPADIAPHFPQLEIIELLGSGGMGAVYKARQREIDRLVALKILPSEAAGDPGFAERFTREARALAKLNHPSIVALYDFGHVHGLHYFIMEYVDGLNLRQLEQAGRLSPREALQIIPQICEALQFAHDEGIVHRDIKPENVLLDKKGRVKIADFGLARILGHEPEDFRLTRAREVMGTPHYMAPEQVEKPQSVDHRADIYSLGVVFYEMLTGELPLGRFAPPSQKVQIDVRLDDVVLRALEKEPARRYQQANEVKTDMETILTHPPAPTAGAGLALPGAGSRPAPSWRRAIVASAAVLVLMAIILAWFWKRANASRAEAQAAALAALSVQTKATAAQKPKLAGVPPDKVAEYRQLESRRDWLAKRVEELRLTYIDSNPLVQGALDRLKATQQARSDLETTYPALLEPPSGAPAGFYYVSGEVRTPGRWSYDSRVTVLQALTSAGDFTGFADKEHVRLTRQDGGSQIINCLKAFDNPSLDPEVHPGDTIHVARQLSSIAAPTAPARAANAQSAEAAKEAFARRYGIPASSSSPPSGETTAELLARRYGLRSSSALAPTNSPTSIPAPANEASPLSSETTAERFGRRYGLRPSAPPTATNASSSIPSPANGTAPTVSGQTSPEEATVNEAVYRQANLITLRQRLTDARTAQERRAFASAAKLYDDAWELVLRIGSGVDAERDQTITGLTAVRMELARASQSQRDYKEAQTQVDDVLRVDPTSGMAIEFKSNNELASSTNVSFAVVANGTNPIAYQWYKTLNDSTNPPAPGPEDLILTRLAPLYVTLALEGVTTNAASGPRYIISVEDAGAPTPGQRIKRQYYCSIGPQHAPRQPFILRDVQGPADNLKVVLELIATKESVSVDKDHAFQRVCGYTADLKYGPENKTFTNRRVGSVLAFARDEYEIVEVTRTEVALRQKSNDKTWRVKYVREVGE
jgi:predicted Ser/Thr protein kinase